MNIRGEVYVWGRKRNWGESIKPRESDALLGRG